MKKEGPGIGRRETRDGSRDGGSGFRLRAKRVGGLAGALAEAVSRMAAGLAVLLSATLPALAQKPPEQKGIVWDDRPSIVFGKNINVDLRVKIELDWRRFDPEIAEDTFDFNTRRVGLKGELTRHFEYEVEREAKKAGAWKDVYVTWRTFRQAEVTIGRFKVPFGFEQMTGKTSTDFAYRSLASSTIAPARDKGVMVAGRFFGRGLTYQAGVFDGDGDNGRLREPQFVEAGEEEPAVGPSVAGRVTATVLRSLPVPDTLKSMRIGAAYTNAELPEGLNSLKGKSLYGTETFFDPVYVKGRRQRAGADLEWTPGPLGLKAEWMQAREDRQKQSNRNGDLSDFVSTGWHVSGTWLVTGEKKEEDINPRKPLFRGGVGAIEIGARYDQLSFGSASQADKAFSNPRADHLVGNADRVWTFGVSWFPNRWLRLIGNAAHENFEDPARTPDPGISSFWSAVFRTRIVF